MQPRDKRKMVNINSDVLALSKKLPCFSSEQLMTKLGKNAVKVHVAISSCFAGKPYVLHAADPEENADEVFSEFMMLVGKQISFQRRSVPIRLVVSDTAWTKHHAVLSKLITP